MAIKKDDMGNFKLKRVCVFCGSASSRNAIYADAAERLGRAIGQAGLGLVYGGGLSGMMGVVAKSAIRHGAYVTGIMPVQLVHAEHAFYNISEYHEVSSFHQRKKLMSDLADGFIVLPGGPGTLEEFIEQLAWSLSGFHSKPIFLINVEGYWNRLLQMLDQIDSVDRDFRKYIVVIEPEKAINMFLELTQSD